MTQTSAKDNNGTWKLTGGHVLTILLSAFAVVLAVNMVFTYYAITTNNPRDARNSYEEGINYNRQLDAEKIQAALGWTHNIEITDGRMLRLTFAAKDGAPVTGLAISGRIGRPASDRLNRDVTFTESQPGVYTAETNELEAGGWLANVQATKSAESGDKVVYSVKELLRWHMPADAARKH